MKTTPKPSLRRGITLIELLVIVTILVVAISLFAPAVQHARGAARRAQCMNNLSNLRLAASNYESTWGGFPMGMNFQRDANGTGMFPSSSSFVAILPYLEHSELLYNSVNFQVNIRNAQNFTVSSVALASLWCPSEGPRPERQLLPEGAMLDPGPAWMCYSSYAGCVGTWCQWKPENNKYINGIFQINELTSLASIKDGTSNTMLFGERVHTSLDKNDALWWHWWTYGNNGDTLLCTLLPMNVLSRRSGLGKAGMSVGYLSGASSMHEGGCEFAFADGSVRFIRNTVDSWPADPATGLPIGISFGPDGSPNLPANTHYGVYQALSTRQGSEVIDPNSF